MSKILHCCRKNGWTFFQFHCGFSPAEESFRSWAWESFDLPNNLIDCARIKFQTMLLNRCDLHKEFGKCAQILTRMLWKTQKLACVRALERVKVEPRSNPSCSSFYFFYLKKILGILLKKRDSLDFSSRVPRLLVESSYTKIESDWTKIENPTIKRKKSLKWT